MSDLDRLLSRALQEVASGYRPSEAVRARADFEARRRRRRGLRVAAGAALVAGVVAALLVLRPLVPDPRLPVEGGDPDAPRGPASVARTFEVGLSPVDVDVGEELVFVAHEERDAAFALDPRTGEVALEFPSVPGDPPTSIALGGGRLYGVNRALASLYAFDLRSGISPPARSTGPEPTDVSYGGDLVWVASSRRGGRLDRYVVTAYASATLERVRGFKTPPIAGLEYGYGYMWAATSGGLFRLDPETGEAFAVAGVSAASDASAGFGALWAYENPASGGVRSTLVRIDPATARITERVPVEGFFGNVEAAEGAGIWVLTSLSEYKRNLLRLDPSSGETLGRVTRLEGGVMEMDAGGDALWLTDSSQGTLRRIEVIER